jgi:hypothetical protein
MPSLFPHSETKADKKLQREQVKIAEAVAKQILQQEATEPVAAPEVEVALSTHSEAPSAIVPCEATEESTIESKSAEKKQEKEIPASQRFYGFPEWSYHEKQFNANSTNREDFAGYWDMPSSRFHHVPKKTVQDLPFEQDSTHRQDFIVHDNVAPRKSIGPRSCEIQNMWDHQEEPMSTMRGDYTDPATRRQIEEYHPE